MKLNFFIQLLKEEFATTNNLEIDENSVLSETFADSSLNILFLRGVINDEFGVTLTDREIKESERIVDLYQKILSKVENPSS
jgi:hypothetical protein